MRLSVDSSNSDRPIYVAVCGGSVFEEEAADHAREIGAELAREGAIVMCGGGGGVMEAVCEGARSEGGMTIGFLPGDDRADANQYVDISIPTGLGEMRNMLLVRASDVVIAISGEFGTLSEVTYALRLGIPVVGLNTWELRKAGKISEAITNVTTPAEAARTALDLATR